MPFTIGLTGGIGSGKSTTARMFAGYGVPIVDTDAISHHLTASGGAALAEIRRHFGTDVFSKDGTLNRAQLRKRVFSDVRERKVLEALLHPLIRAEALQQLSRCIAAYAILVVPLLLETGGLREHVQRVLVVDCDERQQIVRAMSHAHLSEAEVRAIMAAQIDRAARIKLADDVLLNDSGSEHLQQQVNALHRKYLKLAQRDQATGS